MRGTQPVLVTNLQGRLTNLEILPGTLAFDLPAVVGAGAFVSLALRSSAEQCEAYADGIALKEQDGHYVLQPDMAGHRFRASWARH